MEPARPAKDYANRKKTPPPWYPGESDDNASDAVKRLHRHWILSDGRELPTLSSQDSATSGLAQINISLRLLKTPILDGPEAPAWLDPHEFSRHVLLLLLFAGEEDHFAVNLKTLRDYGTRFQIKPQLIAGIQVRSIIDWPTLDSWLTSLEEARARAATTNLVVPDWERLVWQTGGSIRDQYGMRLKPLFEQRGRTWWDKWIVFLEAHPSWLDAFDTLARDFAKSDLLSMLMMNGCISSEGILHRVDCIQLDHTNVAELFGISDMGPFRKTQWPLVVRPLVRMAVKLKHEWAEQRQIRHQATYIAQSPSGFDPPELEASFDVSMRVRTLRLELEDLVRLKTSRTSGDAFGIMGKSQSSALDGEIQNCEEGLSPSRELVTRTVQKMATAYEKHRKIITDRIVLAQPSRYVKYQVDSLHNFTFGTKQPVRDDSASISKEDNEEFKEKIVIATGDMDDEDTVIPPLDLDQPPPPPATTLVPMPADKAFELWSSAITADIKTFENQEWTSLVHAICMELEEAHNDRERLGGVDPEKLRRNFKSGGRLMESPLPERNERRDRFQAATYHDNLFCSGLILWLSSDMIDPIIDLAAIRLQVAIVLACSFLSSRSHLYAIFASHIFDDIIRSYHAAAGARYDRRAVAALEALSNYVSGLAICAQVGSKSHVGNADRYKALVTGWVRNLLFPQATIFDLPLFSGPLLPCRECNSCMVDPSSAPSSGLSSAIRQARIDYRLSVWVFCTRRGMSYEFTRALGRLFYYDCLFRLFELHFHPTFIVCVLYHFEGSWERMTA